MRDADFYRRQAAKARELALAVHNTQVSAELWTIASQYEDVAEDLEMGATAIRHPKLLPGNEP
jgi:hypothetical protein